MTYHTITVQPEGGEHDVNWILMGCIDLVQGKTENSIGRAVYVKRALGLFIGDW